MTATVSWKGWAELENDPAIFSTLLREWGVSNIQVNEVVPLDSIFDIPAESVYGLIFLSRWSAPETANDSFEASHRVWFANQISGYSCATVAIMNIINNHMALDLGQQLNKFRFDTLNLTPKERGEALDRFDPVRNVHNSFATELDTMNIDMRLKDDVMEAAMKQKRREQELKRKSKRQSKKRRKRASFDHEDEENGFHFIAYVPANSAVWRMDGMEPLPRRIDALEDGENWLMKTLADLQSQWESAEANQLEFSLLSLTARTEDVAVGEDEKMMKTRENWGPFIAHMIKLHSEKGDLRSMMA